MKNEHSKFKPLATVIVLGTFIFFGIKGCIADSDGNTEQKENLSDYYASEYFKANVIAPKTDSASTIELAFQERVKHGDKEGGIIRFYENGADTSQPYSAWAYVEYHYPARPDKANAKDQYGNDVEFSFIQ